MKTIVFVLRCALKYKAPLIIAILSMTGLVGLQLFVPWLVRDLIAAVSGRTDEKLPARIAGHLLPRHHRDAEKPVGPVSFPSRSMYPPPSTRPSAS